MSHSQKPFEPSKAAVVGARRSAPPAERNARHIARVLARILPRSGIVLEIASGTGQHAAACARLFADLVWQPSDPDPANRASIAAWREEALREAGGGSAGIPRPPLNIDVLAPDWDKAVPGPWAGLVCINMIHISPWAACEGLLRGAGRSLDTGACLYLYGPYRRNGRHTSPSNVAFDAYLREQNPAWGVRDVENVIALAEDNGLAFDRIVRMPANNLSVILHRT